MKKLIVLLVCIAIAVSSYAQGVLKPVKPLKGQPGKPVLPTPDIKQLRPDLEITGINLQSSRRDLAAGEYLLTVSINIKNNGAVSAGPSSLHLDFQRESTHGLYFDGAKNEVTIGAIPAGTTLLGTYVFHINLSDLGSGTYSLPIRAFADWFNVVAESNESNNGSVPRIITVSL